MARPARLGLMGQPSTGWACGGLLPVVDWPEGGQASPAVVKLSFCSMDGWQPAGLAPRGHDLDEREKMLLGAAIHLLESSEQPQRPGRPDKFEAFVDVVHELLRPGRALEKECYRYLELVGDPVPDSAQIWPLPLLLGYQMTKMQALAIATALILVAMGGWATSTIGARTATLAAPTAAQFDTLQIMSTAKNLPTHQYDLY